MELEFGANTTISTTAIHMERPIDTPSDCATNRHTTDCTPSLACRTLGRHRPTPAFPDSLLSDIGHCLAWIEPRSMEANHGARSGGGPGAMAYTSTSSGMADDNGRTVVELPDPLLHALSPFNEGMAGAALPFASATSGTLPPFGMDLPVPDAPAAFPAFLPYQHPGTAINHPQTHPQAMPCDPSSWQFLASPAPWCSVGSAAHTGHNVGDSEAPSQQLYAPSLAPAATASLPSALVPDTDATRLGNDPGTTESVGGGELRLAVPSQPPPLPLPPPRHGGAAPHPMHLVGPTVDDDVSFPTGLPSFGMSAFSGPGHSEPPASIGPEPLQPSPEPLPDPGWPSDHAWRPTHSSSFTDPSGCPLVGRPHSPSGNVMTYESPHLAQPARNDVAPTRPREAIAPSSGVDSSRGSRVRAAPSGPSRRSQSRQEMKPYMSQFATSSTKRKSFSPGRRQEVAEMRRIGACFTCKLQKGMCDSGDIGTTGPYAGRPASSPLHRVEGRETMCWDPSRAGTTPLQIKMTGLISTKPLEVQCRFFKQVDSDRVHKNIGGSNPGEAWKLPPLAATNFAAIKRALNENFLGWCTGFIGALRSPHRSQKTQTLAEWLHLAQQYADDQPESLTYRALQLWTGANLTQVERGLTGERTLNIGQVQDERSALNGLIPIPPMLDLQIDTVIIRWMCAVQDDLMKDLFKKIREKKEHHILDIFLATFVLSCAAECVACEQSARRGSTVM
ncbi:hypothetical protein MAPG_03761 [Magnaporthiopsis poae ATCC 64411]|uniref:Zn(2)-C6 fungal-type domain-containing protein n=1 Tax=Magnaporthiopsis poae (strain ATCC 64411 / 73-15) TaxID=644358 RepID=A0A0C4DUW6_MAGP6|nr:hypothetical protein MAPG_03761 [Magnaporthiopsis poae ATCC 64411]